MAAFMTTDRASRLILQRRLIPAKKLLYELRAQASDPADAALYNTAIQYLHHNKPDDAARILEDRSRLGPRLILQRAQTATSPSQAGHMAQLPDLPLLLILKHLRALEEPPKPSCARKLAF